MATEAEILKQVLSAMGQFEKAQTGARTELRDQATLVEEQQKVLEDASPKIADIVNKQGEIAAQKILLDAQLKNEVADKVSADTSTLNEAASALAFKLAGLQKDREAEIYNVNNPGFFTQLGSFLGLINPYAQLNAIDSEIRATANNLAVTQGAIGNAQNLAKSAVSKVTNEEIGLALAESSLKTLEQQVGKELETVDPKLKLGQAKVNLAQAEANTFAQDAEMGIRKLNTLYIPEDQRMKREAFALQQKEHAIRMQNLLREKDKLDKAIEEDAYLAARIGDVAKTLNMDSKAVTLMLKSNVKTPTTEVVQNLVVGGTASVPFTTIAKMAKEGGFNGTTEDVRDFANIVMRADTKSETDIAAMGVTAPKSAEARLAAKERFMSDFVVKELYSANSPFGKVFVPQLVTTKSKKGFNPLDELAKSAPESITAPQFIGMLNNPELSHLNLPSKAKFVSDFFIRYRLQVPAAPGVANKFNIGSHKIMFNLPHPTQPGVEFNVANPVEAQRYLTVVAQSKAGIFSPPK